MIKSIGVFFALSFIISACDKPPLATQESLVVQQETLVASSAPTAVLPQSDKQTIQLELYDEWHGTIWSTAWSPDSQSIVLGSVEEQKSGTFLYNLNSRDILWWIEEFDSPSTSVFSPSGDLIVADHMPYDINFLDASSGEKVGRLPIGGRFDTFVDFVDGGPNILLGMTAPDSTDENAITDLYIWEAESNELNQIFHTDLFLTSLDLNTDGTVLTAGLIPLNPGDGEDQVKVWDFPSMTEVCTFPGYVAVFSLDGNALGVVEAQNNITIYETQTCAEKASIYGSETPSNGYSNRYSNFSLSPNGNLVAYERLNCCAVEIFDIRNNDVVYVGERLNYYLQYFSFSPSGEYLLTRGLSLSGSDYVVQIWKIIVTN